MFAFDRSPVPVVTGLAVLLLGAVMTNHPASSQPPDDLSEAQQVAAIDARDAGPRSTANGVRRPWRATCTPDFERRTDKAVARPTRGASSRSSGSAAFG